MLNWIKRTFGLGTTTRPYPLILEPEPQIMTVREDTPPAAAPKRRKPSAKMPSSKPGTKKNCDTTPSTRVRATAAVTEKRRRGSSSPGTPSTSEDDGLGIILGTTSTIDFDASSGYSSSDYTGAGGSFGGGGSSGSWDSGGGYDGGSSGGDGGGGGGD